MEKVKKLDQFEVDGVDTNLSGEELLEQIARHCGGEDLDEASFCESQGDPDPCYSPGEGSRKNRVKAYEPKCKIQS